ncbi:class I SAM-dependent methyltransferase [Desulfoluna butyratoxydans]|uniref:S-adenosyl-l-methionine-dependent methyltransferase n=1 Tax=Desulfoluna butyratoxydans TaxID=231438 RepID=A0A4U8YST5_9BACT|nr:class I SAM-dependent methyltransferase [Desulfoluna butyratoxydans]VFQ47455.1 s-adenosyl-l-methionine-dependent methyltransferase [Desulfoluna butyratoxydans]
MSQRIDEWIEKDNKDYHERQFKEIYRSTVVFCDWLEEIGYINSDSELKILDVGTGQGANLYYMGKRYPKCKFVGIDINAENVEIGNNFLEYAGIQNCHIEVGDIYNLNNKYMSEFDGVVSYQTLSWLPGFEEPLESFVQIDANWIALSSLFYDGHISCTIDVNQYNPDSNQELSIYYNVYSIPSVRSFLLNRGYSDFIYTPFEIDIDLSKPKNNLMGTYTEKLADGKRLQRSGPLLMPWHFIGVKRAS